MSNRVSFLNERPGRSCDICVVAPSWPGWRFCDVTAAAAAVDFRPVASQEGWMTLLNGFLLSVLSLLRPPRASERAQSASAACIRPPVLPLRTPSPFNNYSNSCKTTLLLLQKQRQLQTVQRNVACNRNSLCSQ